MKIPSSKFVNGMIYTLKNFENYRYYSGPLRMALALVQTHWKMILDSMKILSRDSSKSFVPTIWILFPTIFRDHRPTDMLSPWITALNVKMFKNSMGIFMKYLEQQLLGQYQTWHYRWDLYKFDTVWFDWEYRALTESNKGSISNSIPVHHHHYPNETWLL